MVTRIKQLFTPPTFAERDKTNAAHLLHTFLLVFLIVTTLLFIGFLFLAPFNLANLLFLGFGILLNTSCLFIMRRGHVWAASFLLSSALWLATTLAVYAYGGIRTPNFSVYILVVFITGLLLGRPSGIGIAGLSVMAGTILLFLELNNALPPPVSEFALEQDFIHGAAQIILAAALFTIANRSIQNALAAAHQSNTELQAIRVSLEQRTAELSRTNKKLEEEIAERRQAEEALRKTQKLESMGVLAGGIAHDFNNLLTAMLGQTSLALVKLPQSHPVHSHIEKATKAAEHASDLTQQLLAYSGRGQLDIQPININKHIRENLSLLEAIVPKHIHLRAEFSKSLPLINGDASQLQQVLMNLVLNAAEAIGEKKGTVTIVAGSQQITAADKDYWVSLNTPLVPGRYVTLEVHDTGQGMDEETISKIFDPFFTTKFTGRGLGLAAVLGIVRGHKGGLRVYSEVSQGTTFKLLFPASKKEALPTPSPSLVASKKMEGVILVIDDEAYVREAVIDIMALEGMKVVTAADGKTGIDLLRERASEIKVVLLDLSMPGMGGEETFRELKRIAPQIPILLSSGYNQSEAMRHFVGKELTGFVQKPFSATTLIHEIQKYLQQ